MDLTPWVTTAGAAVAAVSAFYAWRQAKSARESATAARQMAEIDASRRHDELAPEWLPPIADAAAGLSSLRVKLRLNHGQLDHLVVDICDSPGITFDVSRQDDAVADRFECNQSMQPGEIVPLWVKAASGHGRRLRLRVTAGLSGKQWEPVLLPELPIVIDGTEDE